MPPALDRSPVIGRVSFGKADRMLSLRRYMIYCFCPNGGWSGTKPHSMTKYVPSEGDAKVRMGCTADLQKGKSTELDSGVNDFEVV